MRETGIATSGQSGSVRPFILGREARNSQRTRDTRPVGQQAEQFGAAVAARIHELPISTDSSVHNAWDAGATKVALIVVRHRFLKPANVEILDSRPRL